MEVDGPVPSPEAQAVRFAPRLGVRPADLECEPLAAGAARRRDPRALAARLERLPEVQLPACRDLGDEARQPGQPVMPLRLTGNAPGQRLRHREVARVVHERNVSDRPGRSRVRCFPAPVPTRASYVDGAMRPYAVSVRSAWRVTTPRHSRVAASL